MTSESLPSDLPSFTVPLRLSEWSHYRRPFRQSGKALLIHHAVIPTEIQRDVLTPLLGTDPLAEQLLVEAALGCSYLHWKKWRDSARRWNAFEFTDLVGEVQGLVVESIADFDPTRQSNFVVHAIGRVDKRLGDKLHPILHSARTGSEVNYKALQRRRTEKKTGERDPHLSDKMRDLIAEADRPFKMTSLNSPVDRDDPDSAEMIDMLPSDILEPEDIVVDREERLESKTLFASLDLTSKEWDALQGFLGYGGPRMSLNELGREMGMARNTVKAQLERAAVKMGVDYAFLENLHAEADRD